MCLAQSAAIFAAVGESGAPRLPPAACEMTPVSSILSGCLSAADGIVDVGVEEINGVGTDSNPGGCETTPSGAGGGGSAPGLSV